jgi:hypothetical protein
MQDALRHEHPVLGRGCRGGWNMYHSIETENFPNSITLTRSLDLAPFSNYFDDSVSLPSARALSAVERSKGIRVICHVCHLVDYAACLQLHLPVSSYSCRFFCWRLLRLRQFPYHIYFYIASILSVNYSTWLPTAYCSCSGNLLHRPRCDTVVYKRNVPNNRQIF